MTPAESVPVTEKQLTDRARVRTLQRRRRRLLRRIAVFLAALAAMVVVVVLNRDTQQLRAMREEGEMVADALQEAYARRRELPLSFPHLDPPYQRLYESYEFNIFYAGQDAGTASAGVCCLKEPVRFFVLGEGRVVVVFDGDAFQSQWMAEREFRAQAGTLGFGALLTE